MKAVVLAGGFGTRLSEETSRIPKPMVEIGGQPILWHILKIYSHHGINDFVICLGYKGYVIKEYFNNYMLHASDVTLDIRNRSMEVHQNTAEPWRITLVDTGLHTRTGGRLARVRSYLDDEPFCMTYGDGVGDVDIGAAVALHRSHDKLATVSAMHPPGRFGTMRVEDGVVRRFSEKTVAEDALINGGFFVLQPEALDYIDGERSSWEGESLERIAAAGELMAYHHRGFWQPMDTLRERRMLQELWDRGDAPWKVW